MASTSAPEAPTVVVRRNGRGVVRRAAFRAAWTTACVALASGPLLFGQQSPPVISPKPAAGQATGSAPSAGPASGAAAAQKPADPNAADPNPPPVRGPSTVTPPAKAAEIPPPPRGFRPALRLVPDFISLSQPLLTAEQNVEGRKAYTKAKPDINKGNIRNRDAISEAVRWKVYRLSLPEERDNLAALRNEIFNDLQIAGRSEDNPGLRVGFQQFFLQEIVNRTGELLDNNFYVRLHAVLLLSQLYVPDVAKGNITDKAYSPAAIPLMKVIDDPQQPEAIKIAAATGLRRIVRTGDPSAIVKNQIGESLRLALDDPAAHPWYQVRLLEVLGAIDQIQIGPKKILVAEVLTKVLVDPKRNCVVRSEAAKQLGRIPLDANVNLTLVSYAIADLTAKMAQEQAAAPRDADWKTCSLNLYLAFRPLDQAERQASAGLLAKIEAPGAFPAHKKAVDGTYKAILPVVRAILKQNLPVPLPPDVVAPLRKWIADNPPADYSITPGGQPITIAPPPPARPATAS